MSFTNQGGPPWSSLIKEQLSITQTLWPVVEFEQIVEVRQKTGCLFVEMVETNQVSGSAMAGWSAWPCHSRICSKACPASHCRNIQKTVFSMTQHHMFPVVHPLDLHAGIYMSVWAFGDICWTGDWPIGQFWGVWSWQHWNKPTIQNQVDLSYSAFTVAVSSNKLFCALEKSTHWGFGPQDTKTT